MYNRKRKRGVDPHAIEGQSTILPVADSLPPDGIPTDGAEYLYSVRLDAAMLPLSSRATNPFGLTEPAPSKFLGPQPKSGRHPYLPSEEWKASFSRRFSLFRDNVRTAHLSRESVAAARKFKLPGPKDRPGWRRFIHPEPNLSTHIDVKIADAVPSTIDPGPSHTLTVEDLNFDDASSDEAGISAVAPLIHITGFQDHTEPVESNEEESDEDKGEGDESAFDEGSSSASYSTDENEGPDAQLPTLALMRRLDQENIVQIVMHYYHWLASSLDNPGKPLDIGAPKEDATDPGIALSQMDARWLFYLLAHLDSDLTGAKEMSLLRSLARVCVSLVRRSLDHSPERRKRQAADDDNDGEEEGEINDEGNATGEDLQTGRTGCWMVLVAVISVWGQADLWLEANARLHSSFHHGESVDTSNHEF